MGNFKNIFCKIKGTIKESALLIINSLRENRYYSYDSLVEGFNFSCGFWDVINISEDSELIKLLWENHISKITHMDYYLSDGCVECIVTIRNRGYSFLKWKMIGETPFFLEYGIIKSKTRYDINYGHNFDSCPELKEWLTKNGKRLIEIYNKDKNL